MSPQADLDDALRGDCPQEIHAQREELKRQLTDVEGEEAELNSAVLCCLPSWSLTKSAEAEPSTDSICSGKAGHRRLSGTMVLGRRR